MAGKKTKRKAPAGEAKKGKTAERTKKTSAKKTSKKKTSAKKKSKTKSTSKRPADERSKKPGLGEAQKTFREPKDVHLLVVDDEPEVLNLLVPFLKKRGYTVSEAEDGDLALEKILTDHPDIVLLDVMMPGLNGWEISQYVRDRPELDPVRIIMATGIGEQMNAATSPLYGADAYIDKPFRLDEVERVVQDVIERIESGALVSPVT